MFEKLMYCLAIDKLETSVCLLVVDQMSQVVMRVKEEGIRVGGTQVIVSTPEVDPTSDDYQTVPSEKVKRGRDAIS